MDHFFFKRKRNNEAKYAKACSSSTSGSGSVTSDNYEKNIDSNLQHRLHLNHISKRKKSVLDVIMKII